MRKIIAFAHLSLDGVMQGLGGAEEDRVMGSIAAGGPGSFWTRRPRRP